MYFGKVVFKRRTVILDSYIKEDLVQSNFYRRTRLVTRSTCTTFFFFCKKKQYLQIQKIHHKALKVVYNSNKNYDKLLRHNNEFSIHQRHLRALICEVFKSLSNLNPGFMWSYFVFKNITYNIRNGPLLRLPSAKSLPTA